MSNSRYLSFSPSYYIDLNEEQQHQLYDHDQVLRRHPSPLTLLSLQPHSSSLSSSSSSSPICFNMGSQLHPSPYQQEVDNFGSYDQTTLEMNKGANTGLKFTICKKEDKDFDGGEGGGGSSSEINGSSAKWMSSKMRLMKRWMKTEEGHKRRSPPAQAAETDTSLKNSSNNNNNSNSNNENTTIRVCSDCNTTKTPLWRSGPKGPKSLCNACGIRQRKARRAMAAATNGSTVLSSPSSLIAKVGSGHKKAPNGGNGSGAQKKRSKFVKSSRDGFQRKLCLEEFALNLSKKLSLHQVFPQEEKDAAILLMALSSGLVHG